MLHLGRHGSNLRGHCVFFPAEPTVCTWLVKTVQVRPTLVVGKLQTEGLGGLPSAPQCFGFSSGEGQYAVSIVIDGFTRRTVQMLTIMNGLLTAYMYGYLKGFSHPQQQTSSSVGIYLRTKHNVRYLHGL